MTPITDKDMFSAYTQRHITMLLLYAFVFLILGLLIAAFIPLPVDDKIISLVNPLITGLFGLASGAVGFWIGRRPTPTPDPATTTIETHTKTTPTPTIVPPGTELVGAPQPPAAIITPPPPGAPPT